MMIIICNFYIMGHFIVYIGVSNVVIPEINIAAILQMTHEKGTMLLKTPFASFKMSLNNSNDTVRYFYSNIFSKHSSHILWTLFFI